jgi:type VI secretion system protein ImpM
MADRSAAPGFYGKAPDFGDFLTRHLPPAFVTGWDAWLRQLMQAAHEQLAGNWPDGWLAAPVWHFGLGAGVLSAAPAWGVLIPSLDKVGRHFPFTIVGHTTVDGAPLRDWALGAESLALGVLEDGFSPAALEQQLAELGAPEARAPGQGPTHQDLPEDPGDWPDLVAQAAGPLAGRSLWWCRGAGPVAPHIMRCSGLPAAGMAGAMVAGVVRKEGAFF